MRPAGPEKGIGIISTAYVKDPTDPQWQDTPEYKEWLAWMKKYNTSGNPSDIFTVYGYSAAQTMADAINEVRRHHVEAIWRRDLGVYAIAQQASAAVNSRRRFEPAMLLSPVRLTIRPLCTAMVGSIRACCIPLRPPLGSPRVSAFRP
jgi:hypothetical protein